LRDCWLPPPRKGGVVSSEMPRSVDLQLPTFRNFLSVSNLRLQTITDATGRLSRNVANYAAGDSRRVKIPNNHFLQNVRRFHKISKKRPLASSCMSVRLSTRPRGTARLPLDAFSLILYLNIFRRCQEYSSFIQAWQQ
jgi:hypothetical protein